MSDGPPKRDVPTGEEQVTAAEGSFCVRSGRSYRLRLSRGSFLEVAFDADDLAGRMDGMLHLRPAEGGEGVRIPLGQALNAGDGFLSVRFSGPLPEGRLTLSLEGAGSDPEVLLEGIRVGVAQDAEEVPPPLG